MSEIYGHSYDRAFVRAFRKVCPGFGAGANGIKDLEVNVEVLS